MKKRILTMFLACILVASIPVAAFAETKTLDTLLSCKLFHPNKVKLKSPNIIINYI